MHTSIQTLASLNPVGLIHPIGDDPIDDKRGPNSDACRMQKTWTTHAAHQSRVFEILNIIFHTTLLPPKIRKSIHGSIISPIGKETPHPECVYWRFSDTHGSILARCINDHCCTMQEILLQFWSGERCGACLHAWQWRRPERGALHVQISSEW